MFLLLLNYIVNTSHVMVVKYIHEIRYNVCLPNLVKELYSCPHRMLSIVYFDKQNVFYITYIKLKHV